MRRLKTAIVGCVGCELLQFVCWSNRLSVTGSEVLDRYAGQGGNIFAFWHSRLFYMVYHYARYIRTPKASALISLSRDGDYAQAVLGRFRQDAVRGSSSRGGSRAIRALAGRLAEGYNVALTPDGPRGPALQVQKGVIRLAQMTGARIIPASYDASRKWTLHSWDRFIFPRPFGRIHLAVGEPLCVPRETSPDGVKDSCAQLQEALTLLDRTCKEQITSQPAALPLAGSRQA